MDQILVMVTIGLLGIIISVAAFIYILRNWDFLHNTNGYIALGFTMIMCGCATATSALSLIFGIAKLFS